MPGDEVAGQWGGLKGTGNPLREVTRISQPTARGQHPHALTSNKKVWQDVADRKLNFNYPLDTPPSEEKKTF